MNNDNPPENQLPRMLAFGQRARAAMLAKKLTAARRTCPWCNAKGGLEIKFFEKSNLSITCTATPNCMNYIERKTAQP